MVTTQFQGRLGNHLFQYAVLKSVAYKTGFDYFIPRNFLGDSLLQNTDWGTLPTKPSYSTTYTESPNQEFSSNIFSIPPNTILKGFFQTEDYFIDIREKVLNWFILKEEILPHILDYINSCVIHIRGGDYKRTSWLLPKDYFINSIEYMVTHHNITKFHIISDDINYSKSMLSSLPYEFYFLQGTPNQDFKTLKLAKYSIISNSSFSWWARWLNDIEGITLAPTNWLNYNHPQGKCSPKHIQSNKFILI